MMMPVEPFFMPLYKCKNCGKIIFETQLQDFNVSYNNFKYHGSWCLCGDCIEKGVNKPKCTYFKNKVFIKDKDKFLNELFYIISQYKVNDEDVFYKEEEVMQNKFLNKYFEYGGTIGDLDESKGNFAGVYIIVKPDNFREVSFNKYSKLKKWRGREVAVLVEDLKNKWIENANILYIGKSKSKTVHRRMIQHKKFYEGKSIAAWGGRAVGQINNFENLEVWYLESINPDQTEKELISLFESQYNQLPFANLRH